jgi:hypothetical protein
MTPFASNHFYDQFVAAIGTNSPNGTLIDMTELDQPLGGLSKIWKSILSQTC